jgi:uncharacterized membrane protein YfcA
MNSEIFLKILSFPDAISSFSVIFIIISSFISSFISSIIGFGGGMLLLGVLALNFSGSVIIPLHAIIQLGSNLNRLIFFKFKVKWNVIIPFALGCIIGVPLGGFFSLSINENIIKILIAFFIIINTISRLPALNQNRLFFTGIISSFLSTIVGVTGSLISSVIQSYKLQKSEYISSCAFLLFTQHFLKCILFGLLGFAFIDYFLLIFLVIIAGIFGTFVGKMLVLRIPEKIFLLTIKFILIVISLNLLINGISNII